MDVALSCLLGLGNKEVIQMTNQEAIDLLDNLIGMIEDNHGSDYDSAIRMAIDALESKWIPCSERLPSDSDYYLVTDSFGDVSVIWFAHEKDYYGKSEWRETEDEILAWMPLPECYRGDSDEN